MSRPSKSFRIVLVILFLAQSLLPGGASGGELFGRIHRYFQEKEERKYTGTEPCTGKDCAVECLAENIDWLEHYVDTYGSVVAKQPDIWGEARLTKHRDEYERIMFQELDEFKSTINAAITQGDSSFLSQAFALSAAASGSPTVAPATGDGQETSVTVGTTTAQLTAARDPSEGFTQRGFNVESDSDAKISLEPTTFLDQMSRYLKHLHELRRINEGDDTSDSPGYSLNLVRVPVSILPGKMTRQGYGAEITITAEPVISDDLMPTTFRNLAINDVVDFLGLPLVRLTERLPEFEKPINEIIASQLLRSTMEKIFLVYEDDNLTWEQAFEKSLGYISTLLQNDIAVQDLTDGIKKALDEVPPESPDDQSSKRADQRLDWYEQVYSDKTIGRQLYEVRQKRLVTKDFTTPREATIEALQGILSGLQDRDTLELAVQFWNMGVIDEKMPDDVLESVVAYVSSYIEDVVNSTVEQQMVDATRIATVAPTGRTRRALNPLNPSSLEPVIGIENLAVIAKFFEPAYYGRSIRWAGGPQTAKKCDDKRVDLLDARRFLRSEIECAYELLNTHPELFADLASPCSGLAHQIRGSHFVREDRKSLNVAQYRHYFFQRIHDHARLKSPCVEDQDLPPEWCNSVLPDEASCSEDPARLLRKIAKADQTERANSSVEALAWAVVAESALLNERLNRDVRKLAEAKDIYELKTAEDQWFFLPDAVMAPGQPCLDLTDRFQRANEVFKKYVAARWPIHVFAIDPVEQDQNVADISQRKRELQFALALGFATGQIGGNSLTQFSRQLETQVEAVSLNKTIVGFGHGPDTFGWRFYPRVQALEVPGTLGAIRETLCGTSRDYDLRRRRLEPGQRECVAMVLMPSFVPYADFDIRSNWFKLTNPKQAALTMKDSVHLSRAITAMRNSRANCSECQHLYREGELRRMFKRIDQLDRELPLQTERALVPYENTLGGFEMFNTGVTDLAPELIGWYGAPGINIGEDFKCGCFKECSLASSSSPENTGAAPLPKCEGKGTTLFLVGDNFSVHDTKVIAGGVCIPNVRLISRELMQVTIPSCVNRVKLCENDEDDPEEYVSVYVATPYGVTNHLHVPTHEPPSKAKLEDQIKAEIAKQIGELDIPRAVASVGPADDERKTVKVTANQQGSLFKLREDLQSGDLVKYKTTSDPRFRNQVVIITAAIADDEKFLTGLQPITIFRFKPLTSFPALGKRRKSDHGTQLLDALARKLTEGAFPDDGKLKLKVVYYATIDGQRVATRLQKTLDMEITRVKDCPDKKSANGNGDQETTHTTTGIDSPRLQLNGSSPDEIEIVPTPDPEPRAEDKDCNCTSWRSSSSVPVIPASNRIAVPAKLVQFPQLPTPIASAIPAQLPEQIPAVVPSLDAAEITQRLERIEQTLQANIQQAGLQQATAAAPLEGGDQQATPAAATGNAQPIINLRVINPGSPVEPAKKWCDPQKFPVLNRMKVKAGEQWRNVRDQLPCN